MASFINSLQSSGMQVVENNSDKTLLITLPSNSDDKYLCENTKFIPVSNTVYSPSVSEKINNNSMQQGGGAVQQGPGAVQQGPGAVHQGPGCIQQGPSGL